MSWLQRSRRTGVKANLHEPPWARIVLLVGDLELPVGSIDRTTRCDMELVDDLLRFQLAARSLGLAIRVVDVRGDLRDLLDLLGVTDQI